MILRGNNGQEVFPDRRTRERFYRLLELGAVRYRYSVHGHCLMTNHVHLAVQVNEEPLSKAIHNLSFRFTQWVNRRSGGTGHLFGGRYRAILVDRDSYLLELIRYIHLNPVRAGMVAQPEQHPWSSHRAYLGMEVLPWLSTHWVLSQLGDHLREARECFARFVADGVGGGHRPEFYRGPVDARVLGDDEFLSEVRGSASPPSPPPATLEEIVCEVCRCYGMTVEELRAPGQTWRPAEARAVIAWAAESVPTLSLAEVAQSLGREAVTLCNARRRLARRAAKNQRVADLLRHLAVHLSLSPR